ncbi:ferric reductase-like transmembrane domain-containing protein [Bordetella petrii]|uniref:ferredoxin reductase family protein n=1 Tax=Bordetella petrii TaxID=94624 RepID=UPI00048E7BE4|nr:ferric reductase-like transmembrane domain-containing protein [Bordetella petrii]
MKRIKLGFVILFVALTALWLLADTFFPQPFGYFPLRRAMVQYTGVLAMGAMSLAMILATRPRWLEPWLGGLDKMYRLHKWLGIAALAVGTVHWLWAQGTKWAVGWGWLVKPAGKGAPDFGALEQMLRSQRGLAETLGEWAAFYPAALLIVLALVKRFPYRPFAKTHTILAVIYLVLVFHAVILLEFAYWTQPLGVVMAVLLTAGAVSALLVLCKRVGARSTVAGRVTRVAAFPETRVVQAAIELRGPWPGHRPGQFAFVTFDRREGAHPYTIASAWHAREREVSFLIKVLGDHTARLYETLTPGQPVLVEGPYGCFTFDDRKPRQIWIGAGIGITPFIARMQYLANHPGQRQAIDLFHPSSTRSHAAVDNLAADARAAGVALHLMLDETDGRLDGARLRGAVPDWRQASVWFCGPVAFGAALRRDLVAHGLAPADFHQELFEMR